MEVETWKGYESCSVCHGIGREWDVAISHKVR